MIKKILPFLCSLAPLYAFGADFTTIELGLNQFQNITAGSGASVAGVITLGGNLMVLNTATEQSPTGSLGDLYILNTADNPFGITAGGPVTIGHDISVAGGRGLVFGGELGSPVNMSVGGNILATGRLNISNVGTFDLSHIDGVSGLPVYGTVTSKDNFLLKAASIAIGNVGSSVDAGAADPTHVSMSIETTGTGNTDRLLIGNVVSSVPTSSIKSATTIESLGSVQNTGGVMNVTSSGEFSLAGSVENGGTSLTVNTGGGAMQVGGTLKNDSGLLDITAASLTVSGGGVANPSFVNSDNTILRITGATSFAYGMNLSGMDTTSDLTITTGTLSLGANNVITNKKSSVTITVDGGALGVGSVVNGELGGASNAYAQMTLSGVGVAIDSVSNYGNLLRIVNTTSTTNDDITISNGALATAGTQTDIVAYDTLTVNGLVDNAGDMLLSGALVNLTGVSNSGNGSVLDITSNNGSVHATGAITNADGVTTISATNIALDNVVTNNSGTLNITGTNAAGTPLTFGSIVVNDGVANIGSGAGGITTGGLDVLDGVLNIGGSTRQFASTGNVTIGGNLYLANSQAAGDGDVYLTATGGNINFTSGGTITVGGDIIATGATSRTATIDGTVISANGVNVSGGGFVKFGTGATTSVLDVAGALSATNGGRVEIYSGSAVAGSVVESGNGLIKVHNTSLVADNGAIQIDNGVYFDDSTTAVGLVIDDALDVFELKNTVATSDITIGGGISVGAGNNLTVDSKHDAVISGAVINNGDLDVGAANAETLNNAIINAGNLNLHAKTLTLGGLSNTETATLSTTNGNLASLGVMSNSGTLTVNAGGDISLTDIESTSGNVTLASNGGDVLANGGVSVSGGTASISGNAVTLNTLNLTGGVTTLSANNQVVVNNAANVSGNVVQGNLTNLATTGGALKLADVATFRAASLNISSGEFIAKSGVSDYVITGLADFGNSINIANGATSNISAGSIETSGDVVNNGTLALTTSDVVAGVNVGNIINNSGLTINTNGSLVATSFNNGANAKATISSAEMNLSGPSNVQKALTIANNLYQNYTGVLTGGDVNIVKDNYTISASGIVVNGIKQFGNSIMTLNTSDVTVGGDIIATDLTIAATPATLWSNIAVGGNMSGGVKVYGLEHMTIGGNYVFDDNSLLNVAVLPYASGAALNTTTYNYWADVSLNDDSTYGQITNRDNDPSNALIYVGGNFASDISNVPDAPNGAAMTVPQIGINLYSIVDPGSAIWLLYADAGLNDLATKIRNLNVNFCNADGSICFNYFDAFSPDITNSDNNGTENELPIYLSVRDYDNDGTVDSLYVVFNPDVGGPVSVFDTDSVIERLDDATDGEIAAAGALDNMVTGQLAQAGFYNKTPIEAIPAAFAGTNLSGLANALYDRMEQYVINRDGKPLANLARLVQPREIEQVAGSIALNEHTSFRDFEDHMFDEFIWNRNRNLNKVWFDADFGIFSQDVSDNKNVSGNRFNLTAGFDWQSSLRTIFGLMARVSHMSADNSDSIDLSFKPGETISGHNDMNVADTNVGVGGYFMHALGFKSRVYGNVMLDMHLLDVSREQNYVEDISGTGTSFSVISELGWMHDWLNQYIVGNLYARFGYNFGFSVTEKADNDDYMNLKSDGYAILTPGYTLIAQKRIYTSPWFQVRPYASIGVEYDVFGMPDYAKYKFASADKYSEYDININPLWANIGGGFEMLSANGGQVGLDYRYQYNSDIQIHNIRLSGSIRF